MQSVHEMSSLLVSSSSSSSFLGKTNEGHWSGVEYYMQDLSHEFALNYNVKVDRYIFSVKFFNF